MIQTVSDLLQSYRAGRPAKHPKKLSFLGCSGYDVYNPTAPFCDQGRSILIGRVERRDSEHAQTMFFREVEEDVYEVMTELPPYDLQDPYLCRIGNDYVLGGTEIFPHPTHSGSLWWRAKFFYGLTLDTLQPLTTGPEGMKDIRLVALADGRIGVFGRPQGDLAGGSPGKITFGIMDDLLQLNATFILACTPLEQFAETEWGGVNETHLLSSGEIGLLGHIAAFSEDANGKQRHYYPMAFTLNPDTLAYSPMKILAERRDFLPGEAKRPDLVDVLFSAGLVRTENGTLLYTGVSDCEVQYIEIEDPFAG